jgi:predicted RNA-binding Zn-ribbon protein involved in translation (DUF1610 family)
MVTNTLGNNGGGERQKERPMADVVKLSCPSCGGALTITPAMERFACGYCGSEHIVRRSGGAVMLAPVVEGLRKVQMGTDRTAAELAIVRLSKEIERLEADLQMLKVTPFEQLYPVTDNEKISLYVSVGLFIIFLVTVNAGSLTASAILIVLCLACFICWGIIDQRRVRSGRAALEIRRNELLAQISDRYRQLKKNQDLVRM